MVINLKNLFKALWPGAVLVVWSIWMFGAALLSFTLHLVALAYIVTLPFFIGDIVKDDAEKK